MLQYVNYRMRITILDGRVLVGTLMAFDRHLNLVSYPSSSLSLCVLHGHRNWFFCRMMQWVFVSLGCWTVEVLFHVKYNMNTLV